MFCSQGCRSTAGEKTVTNAPFSTILYSITTVRENIYKQSTQYCTCMHMELKPCTNIIVSSSARRSILVGGGGAPPVPKDWWQCGWPKISFQRFSKKISIFKIFR